MEIKQCSGGKNIVVPLSVIFFTIIFAAILSYVVSHVNSSSIYVEFDGHNTIYSMLIICSPIVIIIVSLFCGLFNYKRYPILFLLSSILIIIVNTMLFEEQSFVMNSSSSIVSILHYNLFLENKEVVRFRGRMLIQEFVYIFLFLYIFYAIVSVLMEDNYHNWVENKTIDRILNMFFFTTISIHVVLLTWRIYNLHKKSKRG